MKRLLAALSIVLLPILSAALAQVEPIPLATSVIAHPDALTFPGGKPQSVDVQIQLGDAQSGTPVARPGDLYFTSTYTGIVYPEAVALDANGFARIRLTVHPPSDAEFRELGGRILVFVLIDDEDADDTIEGRIVLLLARGEP